MAVRNALIVAYHYPPIRSAGVERTVKFEQYLPEFGLPYEHPHDSGVRAARLTAGC